MIGKEEFFKIYEIYELWKYETNKESIIDYK